MGGKKEGEGRKSPPSRVFGELSIRDGLALIDHISLSLKTLCSSLCLFLYLVFFL